MFVSKFIGLDLVKSEVIVEYNKNHIDTISSGLSPYNIKLCVDKEFSGNIFLKIRAYHHLLEAEKAAYKSITDEDDPIVISTIYKYILIE